MSHNRYTDHVCILFRMLGEDLLQSSRSPSPAMNDTKSSPKQRRKDDKELPDVKERLGEEMF